MPCMGHRLKPPHSHTAVELLGGGEGGAELDELEVLPEGRWWSGVAGGGMLLLLVVVVVVVVGEVFHH